MEILIQPDHKAVGAFAARIVAKWLRNKPDLVLGLAAGRSTSGLYANLVQMHRRGELDFSRVTTFALDEYMDLGPSHPASLSQFLRKNLLDHINIDPRQMFFPDGMASDIAEACRDYEQHIQDVGGIDVQILGIGRVGHIGFNEPTSSLASRTRIKTLTDTTRRDIAAAAGPEHPVPEHALTMGLGTILESRCCLLVAFGEEKADAIAKTAEGPVTAMVPASVLQLHPIAKVVIDEAAASQLQYRLYYLRTYERKPEWQKY
jgi:glucosamine-6-phosphate deaminase